MEEKDVDIRDRKYGFLTLAYDGKLCADTALSLMETSMNLLKLGVEHRVFFISGQFTS